MDACRFCSIAHGWVVKTRGGPEEEEDDDPEAGNGRPALDWKMAAAFGAGQRAARGSGTDAPAARAYVRVVDSGSTRLDRGAGRRSCVVMGACVLRRIKMKRPIHDSGRGQLS
jgi:hypothetical protein